ncbi:MAG: hypothetical protein QOJ27_1446, partial [Sphingomonadales bacterium]|nr:hypothetical protein [Sphingomonadales bacterium]
AMPLALMLAALLSPAPPAAAVRTPPLRPVDRSLSDNDRLRELDIAVGRAYAKGEIDGPAAREFRLGIARIRRQMILMGMQVGYRQRVRLRERIDRLYARLADRRGARAADIRSEK